MHGAPLMCDVPERGKIQRIDWRTFALYNAEITTPSTFCQRNFRLRTTSGVYPESVIRIMQIFVNIFGENTITVEVEESDTIEIVKEEIYFIVGILPPIQSLTYGCYKEMEDQRTLSDYNIQTKCTFFLDFVHGVSEYSKTQLRKSVKQPRKHFARKYLASRAQIWLILRKQNPIPVRRHSGSKTLAHCVQSQ
ncbi:uncharacterized protein [Linepithema humile]|uniref:uncharacterized protein n=1 Tax=Linepithema humile TaxID=83485 RepID=UPI00351ED5C6